MARQPHWGPPPRYARPPRSHRGLDTIIVVLGLVLALFASVVVVSAFTDIEIAIGSPSDDEPQAFMSPNGDDGSTGTGSSSDGAPTPAPESAPPVELEELPATCQQAGTCMLGTAEIAIGAGDEATEVSVTDDGAARLVGMVEIPTAGGPVELPNADVEVEVDEDGNIVGVEGVADIPLPTTGVFSAATLVDGGQAVVGYDWGANLTELGAFLQPDRRYYYFTFEDSFALDTGFDEIFGDVDGLPLSLSAPGDRSVTIVLDPLDPYFYIGGACPDFGSDQRRDDERNGNDRDDARERAEQLDAAELTVGGRNGQSCGLGVSAGGFIPFEAQTPLGAPGELSAFNGHIVVHHDEIPIQSGVFVEGELVARVGSDRVALGANGTVFATVPIVDDVLDLSLPLGRASAGYEVSFVEQQIDLFVAGEFGPDASGVLPEWLPIEPPNSSNARGAARLVFDATTGRITPESFVDISGEFKIGGPFLSSLTGSTPMPIRTTEGSLRIDHTGVRINGRTATQVLPAIEAGGEFELDAFISPPDLSASFVELRGEFGVNGAALGADALLRLDRTGIRANGEFLLGQNRVAVEGIVSTQEVSLSGELNLSFGTSDVFGFLDGVGMAAGDARAQIAQLDVEIDEQRAIVIAEREAALMALRQELFDAEGALRTVTDDISDAQRAIDRFEDRLDDAVDEIAEFLIDLLVPKSLRDEVKQIRQDIDDAEDELDDLLDERTRLSNAVDAAERALEDYEDEIARIAVDVDPRVAVLIGQRIGLVAVAEGAEFFDDILTFDARVEANVAITIGTNGLRGSVDGSVCSNSGCLELVAGSVSFGAQPELCFTAGPAMGCFRL